MGKHEGHEEIKLRDEQISFEDGQLVDEVAKADIPIETAVVTDVPDQVVVEDITVPAPVEVVAVEEVVEQPMAVVQEPVYTQVEPVVAEAVEPVKRHIWPWILGALALGTLGAFAWPRTTPVEVVVEPTPTPVVTPDVGLAQVATPHPEPTTPPFTMHCDGHYIQVTVADGGDSVAAVLDNSVHVQADITEAASGAKYQYDASGLAWGDFGTDWTLALWNHGTEWTVYVNDNALDCGDTAQVTVTG